MRARRTWPCTSASHSENDAEAKPLATGKRNSPISKEPRGERNPRVTAEDQWSRIEAHPRNKEFGNSYRIAFDAFREGIKDVPFPAGTYGLRRTKRP
jgi:putative transposase